MPILTYNVKMIFDVQEDKEKILAMLSAEKDAFNAASDIFYNLDPKDRGIHGIHSAFYSKYRKTHKGIPSQLLIRAEQEVLAAYRSIKSSGHTLDGPAVKKGLSIRLDKRIYSFKRDDKGFLFSIVSLSRRVKCRIQTYEKINAYIQKYAFCDPALFVRGDDIYMSLTFKIQDLLPSSEKALGVDLGLRVFAATSEGNLYIDKKFNKDKRKLRHLKRELQRVKSNGSKSARRALKKLRRKEVCRNKDFNHHLANRIIKDAKCGFIVMEDLTGIKAKKHKGQNKNRISQVSLFELRRILTYKAPLYGKQVVTVSPRDTSQIDSRTGKKDGKRAGRRYIGSDGVVLDADINAACNIAIRSKHPASIGNYLCGQGLVTGPIVGC